MKSSSQTSKGKNYQSNFIFISALILIIFPFFLIKSVSSSILYLFILTISIGFSLFFWINFVPFFPKGFSGYFNAAQMLILSIFRETKSSYHIQAGKFDRDYFFIQNKPKLDALLIDEKSAVIMINNIGRKRVVLPGYRFINHGEKALHTFDIGFHHFFWGPQETEDLFRNHIPIDLSQSHLQSLRVAQTKCQTKDEITVVPSFSVFYDFSSSIGKKHLGEMLINISDYFSINKIFGELQLEINKLIGERITNICKYLLKNTSVKQLTDQNSSLMDDILIKTNTIINIKIGGDTSDAHKKKGLHLLENINPLGQWEMLNIRVFLNNLWIQKDVR